MADTDDTKRFTFDGAEFGLAEMLAANAEDADVCDWLARCEAVDTYDGDLKRVA